MRKIVTPGSKPLINCFSHKFFSKKYFLMTCHFYTLCSTELYYVVISERSVNKTFNISKIRVNTKC